MRAEFNNLWASGLPAPTAPASQMRLARQPRHVVGARDGVRGWREFFRPDKTGTSPPWIGKKLHRKTSIGPQNTGITTNEMGFGTWAWGNKLLWGYDESQDEELERVFELMVDNGVTLFDTADSYGTGKLEGRSEELLGRFTRQGRARGDRTNVHIATKLAAYPWRTFSSKQWVSACRASLARMGLEKMSMAQLHWSTANYQPIQEQIGRAHV